MEKGAQTDEDADDAPRGFTPEQRVSGVIRPGGSKSQAQRALLLAAACEGTTVIEGLPRGADVAACVDVVSALAARVSIDRVGGRGEVTGVSPQSGGWLPARPLVAGESGTLARLVTAMAGLCGAPAAELSIEARGSLADRASAPLFEALRAVGVVTTPAEARGWPVSLRPARPPARLELVQPVSSQEVTGLLLACASLEGERLVEVRGPLPSRPYVELTCAMLRRFGVAPEIDAAEDVTRIRVRGPVRSPRETLQLEPDASSSAVALAAACLSGGEVHVPGLELDSEQGDVRIVEHLSAFGCVAHGAPDGLHARGAPTRGAVLDLSGEPDLAPVLAIIAAEAARTGGGESELRGLGSLPGKESDRLLVLAAGLSAAGLRAEAGADRLRISAGSLAASTRPLRLDPRGDHRMAFAFALLGFIRPGVLVAGPACVTKSWPGFWDELKQLCHEKR